MRTAASIFLALLVVVGVAGAIATHAVRSKVVSDGYYNDALAKSRVFDRMYDELLVDPTFAPQVDELLGGVDVKRADLVATIKQLVTPERLQAMADEIIKHLVAHFGKGDKLDLTFDITPIVQGIHDVAIQAAVAGLKALPTKEAASYDEFLEQFQKVLGLMQGQGTLPDAIPTFTIPDEDKEQVAGVLVQACGLDESDADQKQVIDFIRDAVGKNDLALAIRVSAAALLEKLIDQSIAALTQNEYVGRISGADGDHYLLGPGAAVTAKVDEQLAVVRQLNDAATWAAIGAGAALVLALVGLALLHRQRRARLLAWTGASLAMAGGVTLTGWLIAKGMVQGQLGDVAASPGLPPTFQAILKDVLESSVGGLSSAIWIPAAAVAGLGVLLIGGAVASRARA